MLDKVKIVCAISAIPVAITNLVSYLYHSYTALCALIISGIAVVLFGCLYRWSKKTNPQDRTFRNPFFIFMCIFSFVFLLSGSVMIMGGMTKGQHRKVQTWTWADADSVRILKNRVLESPGAESLIELGTYYMRKGKEEWDMSLIQNAREYFLRAALEYSSPAGYYALAAIDENGLGEMVNSRAALKNYINGLYCSNASDSICDVGIRRLTEKYEWALPDSVQERLEKRKKERKTPFFQGGATELSKYLKTHSPYQFIIISKDGSRKEIMYDAYTAIISKHYPIQWNKVNIANTISANQTLCNHLQENENDVLEKALRQIAYGNFLFTLNENLRTEIKSFNQLF